MNKISIPKGTRDFSPREVLRRNYIVGLIKNHFLKFGFSPIETPSMEHLSTLSNSYGEDGEKLIFKILNSGDYLRSVSEENFQSADPKAMTPLICEKALRYDLTIPFARYVVQHRNEIQFPFKRYQIQPVWRADRPQKGRFREFWQCDADSLGSESLWLEVEYTLLYEAVFKSLNLPVSIEINHRKILAGIAEIAGMPDRTTQMIIALDKLQKVGADIVKSKWRALGMQQRTIDRLEFIFHKIKSNSETISHLSNLLSDSKVGKKGLDELCFVLQSAESLGVKNIVINPTLARGLDYYTGSIYEVTAQGISLGSIGGGGRYDDLTGRFGLKGVSGIGISFGLDRIYLALEEKGLFPSNIEKQSQIIFINFGQDEAQASMQLISELRKEGVSCELYPDCSKLKKQLSYADKRGFKYVAMIGTEELHESYAVVKELKSGEQFNVSFKNLVSFFSNAHD